MGLTASIDITPQQRKTILDLLKTYLPNTQTWVYGSRAKWTAKPHSDLDLVVFVASEKKLKVSDLKEAFEESDLPFRVDLFVWDEVPGQFRKNIQSEHVVLQKEEARVVPSGWDVFLLEDCMEAIIDYRGKTPKKTTSGVPLVTAKIVKGGRILPVGEFIAEDDYDAWMRRGMPKEGDILMTTEAPLGEIAQLDSRKVALAQRLITLRGKSGFLDNSFLKFLMQSAVVQDQLIARSSGTTVLGIKQSELRKVELPIPSIGKQKAIAHILGALDDKIELSRKMNETLEAQAQALFKSWFVDFDPVIDNALAAGNSIPEELAKKAELRQKDLFDFPRLGKTGLNFSNPWKLFPDSFQPSEFGPIPEGWGAIAVSGLIQINPRVSLSKGTVAPFADMKALPTSGCSVRNVITKEYKGGAKFQQGDTLLARITPCLENGKTVLVDFLSTDQVGFGSTEFIVMRGDEKVSPEFVYCLARSEEFRKHCIASMVGSSGRQRVQNDCFNHYKIAEADSTSLKAFRDMTRPLFSKITKQAAQARTLSALRDTLLPKLLSGELKIEEAEGVVERIAVS